MFPEGERVNSRGPAERSPRCEGGAREVGYSKAKARSYIGAAAREKNAEITLGRIEEDIEIANWPLYSSLPRHTKPYSFHSQHRCPFLMRQRNPYDAPSALEGIRTMTRGDALRACPRLFYNRPFRPT